MKEILFNSLFFGFILSLLFYMFGIFLKKKLKLAIFNPLLIAVVLSIIFLIIFKIDYEIYNEGAKYLSYLLTPATVCFAIPLYKQLQILKKNALAIFTGIFAGVISSLGSILLLSMAFGLTNQEYVTLLPKSITMAIGVDVAEEFGGIAAITAASILITGIVGNVIAERTCKIFKITDPIAKGIAIGSSSHVIGTSKALEMGEIEGAVSSLSIVVSGIITVIAASLFVGLI